MHQLEVENFTLNMRRLMKERNLSYIDLERLTNIARSSLNEYVNGKHKMPLDYAVIIAKALGKTLDEMLTCHE